MCENLNMVRDMLIILMLCCGTVIIFVAAIALINILIKEIKDD